MDAKAKHVELTEDFRTLWREEIILWDVTPLGTGTQETKVWKV